MPIRSLDIAGPGGRLEAVLMTPAGAPRAAAVLCHAHPEFPEVPLVLGGFSFGALVALSVGLRDERVERVLAVGLPVSLGGVERENPSGKPILFVQGERDEFGDEAAICSFVATCPGPSRLTVVPGARHLFEGEISEVERAVVDWVRYN